MTSLTKQQDFSISWCPREKSHRLMSAHLSAQVTYATVKNFNTYVTLSRSWGWDTIRLLQDFRWEIITKHLSEELQEEDERLEKLTSATKSKFEQGGFTYHWHQPTTCLIMHTDPLTHQLVLVLDCIKAMRSEQQDFELHEEWMEYHRTQTSLVYWTCVNTF